MNDTVYTVYEGKQPVGELTIEACGLYYEIIGKVQSRTQVHRIYGIREKDSFCIGIPDKNGDLFRRIAQKSFIIPERVILSNLSPESWLPWSGDAFGPMIYDGLICTKGTGWDLAIHPDEWEKIPQWREIGKRETVLHKPMILIELGMDGQPLLIERKLEIENGGTEYETYIPSHSMDIDPLLLADLPADYDYGSSDAEEADRYNL